MATQNLPTQTAESKTVHEWQKERLEVIGKVQEHILDPLVTFTQIIREHEQVENGIDFSATDMSVILRLILLGCYSEVKFYATYGGSFSHFSADVLKCLQEDWNKLHNAPEVKS